MSATTSSMCNSHVAKCGVSEASADRRNCHVLLGKVAHCVAATLAMLASNTAVAQLKVTGSVAAEAVCS